MPKLITFIHGLAFWFFIAIKVAGTSLAAWSWWWLLLPIVPFFATIVRYFAL